VWLPTWLLQTRFAIARLDVVLARHAHVLVPDYLLNHQVIHSEIGTVWKRVHGKTVEAMPLR
jgi:hypothetical protein